MEQPRREIFENKKRKIDNAVRFCVRLLRSKSLSMKNSKIKVGDKIKYLSFGKVRHAVVKKIVPKDQRELKILRENSSSLTSIKIKNVLP